jgi:hypothetical protein
MDVKRELKILRRPASIAILDDASVLAVLSTDHQVDIYDMTASPPKHTRVIALDNAPRTICLAPTGAVLAAAYDAGVEVYSLSTTASSTDRRAVKCDAVDSLCFSDDGTQLLGTTLQSRSPSTVILTAPYFDPGDCPPEESVSYLWTTSILFPHSSKDCSHAVLLPSPSDDETSWAFTYDRVFETFRAVRIDDLRNGTTYFTGPQPDLARTSKLLPSTLPAATCDGDLVAAGFRGKEVWLYGVPENLNSSSNNNQSMANHPANEQKTSSNSLSRSNSSPSASVRSHTWPRDPTSNRVPQWQLLSDVSRNTVVEGRIISTLPGINALRWVNGVSRSACDERLVIAASGVVGQQSEAEEDSIAPIDGGRFAVLDFYYGLENGKKTFLTIEVGENEAEVLEEEHRDMETEVAIVRRRTVAQRGDRTNALRPTAARTALPTIPAVPPAPRVTLRESNGQGETESINSLEDPQEALDAPYAHGAPRSAQTLRRAATAAAINRVLHPPRVVAQEHIQYRRADGREEHPHESDADNWVPPPPPYTREPVAPLPEHLRNAVLAGSIPSPQSNLNRSSTQRSGGSTDSTLINSLNRSRTMYVAPGHARRPSDRTQRRLSDPTSLTTSEEANDRPSITSPNTAGPIDDIYDVSPQDSPVPELARLVARGTAPPEIVPDMPSEYQAIPRRPVPVSVPAVSAPTGIEDVPLVREGVRIDHAPHVGSRSPPPAPFDTVRPSTGSSLTQLRLDAPVPIRPNSDHHLRELPPTTPIIAPPSSPPNEHLASIRETSPVYPQIAQPPLTTSPEPIAETSQGGYSAPDPSLLARLNSRSGRPPGCVLTDPSRRNSGHYLPQQPGSATYPPYQHPPIGGRQSPARSRENLAPQNNHSAYTATASNFLSAPHPPPSRHFTASPSRPRVTRLETIHSVASQGDGGMMSYVRSANIGRARSNRAERSASLNVQQAKRRGWGGTRKEKKRKRDRDGASSAGWTDLTNQEDGGGGGVGEKKGMRCVVM